MNLDVGGIEQWIAQAASSGWDWFEHAPAQVKDQINLVRAKDNSDLRAEAAAWQAFESTPEGRFALQRMVDRTLNKAVHLVGQGLNAEQMAIYGATREGQNNLAETILKLIAVGRDPENQPKPRDVS